MGTPPARDAVRDRIGLSVSDIVVDHTLVMLRKSTDNIATEPAKMNFLESSLKYYFRREINRSIFLEKISIKNIQ